MRLNVYSSAVFAGGRPLCTQIFRPAAIILDIRKVDTPDYLTVKTAALCSLRSLVLTQYRSVTDGRTDLP